MKIHYFAKVPLITGLALWTACYAGIQNEPEVRPPTVAGQFYPSDAGRLQLAIQQFIKKATPASTAKPIALVVPHAGYIFSGQIMADGYRQASGHACDVVVILGTNHTTPGFHRISVYPRGAYQTPLGKAAVDETIAAALLAEDKDCTPDREAQAGEHSVEVQVPFVQVLFPKAKIVPVVVGAPDLTMCTHFGEVLAKVLKNRKALIVASSDLSHYPEYEDAVKVDRQTLEAIVKLDPREFASKVEALMGARVTNLDTCACGEAPILAAIAAAKFLGATRGVVVSYANSGDVAVGDKSRVVGYGAVVLTTGSGESDVKNLRRSPPPPTVTPLKPPEKKQLLEFARETIHQLLTSETTPLARGMAPRLQIPQGAFVTLKKHGELRGCIGHMMSDTPLGQTVGAMAVQAASNDPRFGSLTANELPEIEIEISVLTPVKQVAGSNNIVVGRDGVVLIKDGRSAVFLPQVATENKWGLAEMLDNLCLKAGLPVGSWKEGTQFYVFQADVFHESQYK